jgi:hypothetical protein
MSKRPLLSNTPGKSEAPKLSPEAQAANAKREARRKYRAEHREAQREYGRKYRAEHPEIAAKKYFRHVGVTGEIRPELLQVKTLHIMLWREIKKARQGQNDSRGSPAQKGPPRKKITAPPP